jgi:hypothetical protein
MKHKTFPLCWMLLLASHLCLAQNLYIAGNGINGNGDYSLGQFDPTTCTYCEEFVLPNSLFSSGMTDVVALPNGQVLVWGAGGEFYIFDPPNPTPLVTVNLNGTNQFFGGGLLMPNGNIYISGFLLQGGNFISKLYEYNTTTNTVSEVGNLPANQFLSDLFFWNGQLYGFVTDETNVPTTYHLSLVQLGPPITLTVQETYGSVFCGAPTASITSGPNAGIYTGALDQNCSGSDLFEFDLPNNSTSLVCEILPTGYPYGLSSVPSGFPPPPLGCSCQTDAGSVEDITTNVCVPVSTTVPFDNNAVLDANDILRYILFSNPADTLGSIVAISATPSFTFNPATMQTGVTYYLAAIAGDNLNGSVNLNDPCLDISNAAQVVWRPLPTVTFSAANPNVCAGACTTVTATFTGTAPFSLTYISPASGTVTQTFSGNTGTFQVCTPPGSPPGSLLVSATALVDANCSCQ